MYGQQTSNLVKPPNVMADDILFATIAEAETVRSAMLERLDRYGSFSVAEFKDMVGIGPIEAVEYDWGWRNLRDATIKAVREGYLLLLPRIGFLK